jgi:hypothetical protein
MAKKTARTRSSSQRNKPKAQKSVELVPQTSTQKEVKVDSSPEPTNGGVATSTGTAQTTVPESQDTKVAVDDATAPAPKTSASARLAARRQAAQKVQHAPAALVTAEHYSYVRKDLITIAILAIIMFSIIIGLHFVFAVGV